MATLNTLRTRGALILTIFIGVALIAFLLQDLTSASSVLQSRRNRVGSIAGTGIDYMEYVTAQDNLETVIQNMYGRTSLTLEETDQVNDMLWDSYIRRYAYEPGYRRLGLTIGEAEQVDMVQGEYTSPVIVQFFSSPDTGMFDPAVVPAFIAQIDQDATGQMAGMWNYAKSEMVSERQLSKFVAMVRSASMVNDLEVRRGVAAANSLFNAHYAMLPFSGIADSLVTVTSSEARKYYNEHKDRFRQAASRGIEYVTFEVAPTEADFAAAAEHVAGVAEEFAAAADPDQYASLNSHDRLDPAYYNENTLSGDLLAIAFGARKGEIAGPTLTGNVYSTSRVSSERMMPDSVGARHILLHPTLTASADSLVRAIRGGADIFALAPGYTIDTSVDLGRFPPEMMVTPFAEAMIAHRPGDVFPVVTDFGTHVVQMTYKTPMVPKVKIATITYNVEPSATTEQAAYTRARDFLTAAAGSKENFDAAVTSTGANRRVATIGQNDRDVSGLVNSREIVRWSFNTKPGVVSPIMDIDGDYVVAVVTEEAEAGIADIRTAAPTIVQRLRNDKKTEMLTAQITGRSISEVTAMTGAQSGEITGLKADALYDPTLGLEPGVIGALGALTPGNASKPIAGYAGVFMVTVDSVEPAAEPVDEASERVRLEAETETSLAARLMQALVDQSDIEDYRQKFF